MQTKNIRIGEKNYQITSDDQYLAEMGDNFEPCMVQLFRALLGKDDVVADIGANIGMTALLFADLARQVYAFEPSPSTFQLLQKNIETNGASNVQAFNLGLGEKQQTLNITYNATNRAGGFISEKIRPVEGHITEEIRVDSIDQFFAVHQLCPTFLKMDVEGFEQSVVKGGSAFLSRHEPTVVMEMNHYCLGVLQRITLPDFLDFLRSVFPVLYAIDTDNATVIDLHQPEKAYYVMHEHVVRQRFPNVVGGFTPAIKTRLDAILSSTPSVEPLSARLQKAVNQAMAKTVQGQKFNTPPLQECAGQLDSGTCPDKMSPGQELCIEVSITNTSPHTWHGYGSHPVLLSYHWLDAGGATFQHDGLRTPLTCETVNAGQTATEKVNVVAPAAKGQYQLMLTLLQEGICWFEHQGFQPAMHQVQVG